MNKGTSEVFIDFIERNDLEAANFCLIQHVCEVNWRQKYRTPDEKLHNISTGLSHAEPIKKIELTGFEFFAYQKSVPRSDNIATSLRSNFTLGESQYHIPMMNLHIDFDIDVPSLLDALSHIKHCKDGFLIKTDRFYHFFGSSPLSVAEWLGFLSDFLMPTFLVSPRYVGHALYWKGASIRLNACPPVKPTQPYVIAKL